MTPEERQRDTLRQALADEWFNQWAAQHEADEARRITTTPDMRLTKEEVQANIERNQEIERNKLDCMRYAGD